MNRFALWLLPAGLALTSCATLRHYPVCVVPGDVPAGRDQLDRHLLVVKDALALITGRPEPPRSISSYGLYLRATPSEQKRVQQHWPNLACVPASDGGVTSEQLYRICQADIARYLEQKLQLWPGPVSQGLSFCEHPDVANAGREGR